ncbi:DUF6597 domain-containing transcriptional factor [Tistrella bauzanensis]
MAATGAGAGVYREHAPPPALGGMVQAVWHARTPTPSPGPTPAGTAPFRVLPDGCMDLIVAHGGGHDPTILIAGTDDTARMVAHQPGRGHIGLRFRPGRLAALIDAPPAELVGASHRAALLLAGGVHDAARHLADAPADPARLHGLLYALRVAIEDRNRFRHRQRCAPRSTIWPVATHRRPSATSPPKRAMASGASTVRCCGPPASPPGESGENFKLR